MELCFLAILIFIYLIQQLRLEAIHNLILNGDKQLQDGVLCAIFLAHIALIHSCLVQAKKSSRSHTAASISLHVSGHKN